MPPLLPPALLAANVLVLLLLLPSPYRSHAPGETPSGWPLPELLQARVMARECCTLAGFGCEAAMARRPHAGTAGVNLLGLNQVGTGSRTHLDALDTLRDASASRRCSPVRLPAGRPLNPRESTHIVDR